jgi:hypothetical protein
LQNKYKRGCLTASFSVFNPFITKKAYSKFILDKKTFFLDKKEFFLDINIFFLDLFLIMLRINFAMLDVLDSA